MDIEDTNKHLLTGDALRDYSTTIYICSRYKQLIKSVRYFCVILYINITEFSLNLLNVILTTPLCTYNQQKQVKFCTTFVSYFSHSKKNSGRNYHRCTWINLTLYAPRIILQYVYKPTRCTKFL